jgi:competence protein ComGC
MKKSFTLIELLIVLLVVSLVIGLVTPRGAKLLDAINNKIDKYKNYDKYKDEQYKCFLKEEANNTLGINKYGIKIK